MFTNVTFNRVLSEIQFSDSTGLRAVVPAPWIQITDSQVYTNYKLVKHAINGAINGKYQVHDIVVIVDPTRVTVGGVVVTSCSVEMVLGALKCYAKALIGGYIPHACFYAKTSPSRYMLAYQLPINNKSTDVVTIQPRYMTVDAQNLASLIESGERSTGNEWSIGSLGIPKDGINSILNTLKEIQASTSASTLTPKSPAPTPPVQSTPPTPPVQSTLTPAPTEYNASTTLAAGDGDLAVVWTADRGILTLREGLNVVLSVLCPLPVRKAIISSLSQMKPAPAYTCHCNVCGTAVKAHACLTNTHLILTPELSNCVNGRQCLVPAIIPLTFKKPLLEVLKQII